MPCDAGHQHKYDEATFDFSRGNYDDAVSKFREILAEDPSSFESRLALGMALCRKGDFAAAIAEGHKAEQLRPNEQLVHTNLSLFYMKAGDKVTAEHHGLQARLASWKTGGGAPPPPHADPDLALAKAAPAKPPEKFPDMPWKKKTKPVGGSQPTASSAADAPPAGEGVVTPAGSPTGVRTTLAPAAGDDRPT